MSSASSTGVRDIMAGITIVSIDDVNNTVTFNCGICSTEFTENIADLLYGVNQDGTTDTEMIRIEHVCGAVVSLFDTGTNTSIFTTRATFPEATVDVPIETLPSSLPLKSATGKKFDITVNDTGDLVSTEVA